jgi:kynurenine--oxoglutarate transaminase/cysteine-S-conjugate beta-lyase/glutamine--phenylpyruvate transaminase/kynurenine aminotransferase
LIDQLLASRYNFHIWIPESGYFVLTDISKIDIEDKYLRDEQGISQLRDFAFCLKVVDEAKVVGIPCSVFYD